MTLERFKHEIGSLKHRMDAAEKSSEALSELASSVKVMTVELRNQ